MLLKMERISWVQVSRTQASSSPSPSVQVSRVQVSSCQEFKRPESMRRESSFSGMLQKIDDVYCDRASCNKMLKMGAQVKVSKYTFAR